MKARGNYARVTPGLQESMESVEAFIAASALERPLYELIKLRISQVNGCAYCNDMHLKDLRALGDPEQRLYGLGAWEERGYYTARGATAMAISRDITSPFDSSVYSASAAALLLALLVDRPEHAST